MKTIDQLHKITYSLQYNSISTSVWQNTFQMYFPASWQLKQVCKQYTASILPWESSQHQPVFSIWTHWLLFSVRHLKLIKLSGQYMSIEHYRLIIYELLRKTVHPAITAPHFSPWLPLFYISLPLNLNSWHLTWPMVFFPLLQLS